MTHEEPAPMVLVHGAWHGGWCWERVTPHLRAAGVGVSTPSRAGRAERAAELKRDTGPATHIADIVSVLEAHDLRRVILVGHSYGGMVISGVAGAVPERLAHLVYLDAFVPAPGESLMDLLPPDRAVLYAETARTLGDGWRIPPPPVARFGVVDAADTAWATALLTDQPLLGYTQPLPQRAASPRDVPRTYIHCTQGPIAPTFAPVAARARVNPTWRFREMATGHDAMITEPAALAGMLLACQDLTTRNYTR